VSPATVGAVTRAVAADVANALIVPCTSRRRGAEGVSRKGRSRCGFRLRSRYGGAWLGRCGYEGLVGLRPHGPNFGANN
jgi:hypothetical protein